MWKYKIIFLIIKNIGRIYNYKFFILAAAFNDFGVPKNLAEYVMGNFSSNDFKPHEIKRTIDSAYAQVQNFGTKYYEDEEKVNKVKQQLRRGVSKKKSDVN